MGKELGLISEPPLIKLSNHHPPPPPPFPCGVLQGQKGRGQPSNSRGNFQRWPPSPFIKIGSRYRKSAAKGSLGVKWTMALKNGTWISVWNILSRNSDVPLFPAGATQKGMFHSLFKGVFRKLLSTSGKQPQSRFPTHEGKFSLFPSSSPKGRPWLYLLSMFANKHITKCRRKYWTSRE